MMMMIILKSISLEEYQVETFVLAFLVRSQSKIGSPLRQLLLLKFPLLLLAFIIIIVIINLFVLLRLALPLSTPLNCIF